MNRIEIGAHPQVGDGAAGGGFGMHQFQPGGRGQVSAHPAQFHVHVVLMGIVLVIFHLQAGGHAAAIVVGKRRPLLGAFPVIRADQRQPQRLHAAGAVAGAGIEVSRPAAQHGGLPGCGFTIHPQRQPDGIGAVLGARQAGFHRRHKTSQRGGAAFQQHINRLRAGAVPAGQGGGRQPPCPAHGRGCAAAVQNQAPAAIKQGK